ncbi:hypothetical protein, partial [Ottowia sp.]|uniref:hypothetical protein n=1 Tax=Ottowia sp. TaxID=1898956 RepID=UPI003A87E000
CACVWLQARIQWWQGLSVASLHCLRSGRHGADFCRPSLGAALDQKRADAKARISDMPSLAVNDPSVLAPVGPYFKKWDDNVAKWRKQLSEAGITLPDRPQERLQHQISITQVQIATDYRLSALKAIRDAVRNMQWPKDDDSTKVSN